MAALLATKKLSKSEIHSRLALHRHEAEKLILPLMSDTERKAVLSSKGLRVLIKDIDTDTSHYLTFKNDRISTSGQYVLTGDWNKEFVKRRGLKEGDVVGLHWNFIDSCFFFVVTKSAEDADEGKEAVKKILSGSEIKYGRLTLPMNDTEKLIMPLLLPAQRDKVKTREGLTVLIKDLDTNTSHNLTFKNDQLSTSGRYVLQSDWKKEFVTRRGLKAGDVVGLHWDTEYSGFGFEVIESAAEEANEGEDNKAGSSTSQDQTKADDDEGKR